MRKKKSSQYHRAVIQKVNQYGVVMAYKCVSCQKSGGECKRSSHSSSCLRCLQLKRVCNMEPFSEEALDRMIAERDRLRAEKVAAEEAEDVARARRRRATKQEELLDRRFQEAVQRGLENIEELEKVEREEEESRARQGNAAAGSSSPPRQESLVAPSDPTQPLFPFDLSSFDELDPSWFEGTSTRTGQPSTQPP